MGQEPLRTVLHQLRRLTRAPDGAGVSDAQLVERFVTSRDEAAFELLVRRHERLVLNVCRRALRDSHDVEDAFQATFLVLVRKAASIGKRESVAAWLYKVAYRVALRARAGAAQRAAHERPADLPALPAPEGPDAAWRELRPLLDQEVSRLPEKYRVPVVLCYLESRTYDEAARELGCSRGTVSTRLTRARELLRRRLVRRGLTLSAALVGPFLVERAAPAAVPARLTAGTVRAALLGAAGAADGLLSANVVSLTEGALQAMRLTKRLILTGVACAAVAVGLGTGAVGYVTYAAGQADGSAPRTADQALPQAAAAPPNVFEAADEPASPRAAAGSEGGWRERVMLTNPGGQVQSVAFTPDGKLLATAAVDGVLALWDTGTGRQVLKLDGRQGERLNSAAFSPDGKVLATGDGQPGQPGAVRLWDVATGKEVAALRDPADRVRSVAFSPDGRVVAAGSSDGTVRLWDVRTAREHDVLRGNLGPVSGVAFSPDGKRLASAGGEEGRPGAGPGELKLWDVTTGKVLAVCRSDGGTVTGVAFSPDGRVLATSGAAGAVRLWDAATGKELRRLVGLTGSVQRVVFSPDGKVLASGGSDGTVRLWDVATGKEVSTISAPPRGFVGALAFSPDGRLLAVGGALGDRGYVVIWERVGTTAGGGQAVLRGSGAVRPQAAGDGLDQLLQEMLKGQRSDEQIVEALFLATLGRYPRDTELKFALETVRKRKDRGEAFADVLYVLTNSPECRAHVEALEKRVPSLRK
jgi:RNA polymerase sigma factor (sigma-70 family)